MTDYFDPKDVLSEISDEVNLTANSIYELMELFESLPTSSGIIMGKTVPIRGIRINVIDGWTAEIRIFSRYDEIVDYYLESYTEGRGVKIGELSVKPVGGDRFHIFDMMVEYGSEEVMFLTKEQPANAMLLSDFLNSVEGVYTMINLLLLHPKLKEVLEHPRDIRFTLKRTAGQTNKRRITRYLRVHTIKDGDIKEKVKQSKKMNCPCWYVIGHWRKYKNGRKVFIQGYWKGILRESKKNLDEGRERRVDAN